MAEYQVELDNTSAETGESASTTAHFVGLGLYYTGRRNLLIGVGGATQLGLEPVVGQDAAGAPLKSGSPSLWFGQFILRYVW